MTMGPRPPRTLPLAIVASLLITLLASAAAGAGGPARRLAMGVSMLPDRSLERLDGFTGSIGGQAPAIWTLWVDWGGPNKAFPSTELLDGIVARGAVPMIIWQPVNPQNLNNGNFRYRRIADGGLDPYIRKFARAAAQWGGPVILRFAHEMNGDWFPWGMKRFDNTPKRFIAAWRHVWDLFRGPGGEGATNVRFLWSPYTGCAQCVSFRKLWPGPRYVQYKGFSAFNWNRGGLPWRQMSSIFRSPLQRLAAFAPKKPIIVSETASSNRGGDKAQWIRKGYNWVLKNHPRVVAIVYFNVRITGHPNWLLTKPAAALATYADLASKPKFQRQLNWVN